jgi:hypothetical protein
MKTALCRQLIASVKAVKDGRAIGRQYDTKKDRALNRLIKFAENRMIEDVAIIDHGLASLTEANDLQANVIRSLKTEVRDQKFLASMDDALNLDEFGPGPDEDDDLKLQPFDPDAE